MAREYYSIPEAAALLGVSRIAVFKKVKSGRIAALRFGRNWAVPAGEVGKLLAAAALPRPVVGRAAAPRPVERQVLPPAPDTEMDSMGWD